MQFRRQTLPRGRGSVNSACYPRGALLQTEVDNLMAKIGGAGGVCLTIVKLPMRTLFLNPPSFQGFDGGASSRWPASREIESYWYPVWLCYPAGMLPDSKVVDAPPHKISIERTVAMAKDFELLVLYTSTPGFHVDVKMAEMMKDSNPKLKVAFVGPPVTVEPEKILHDTPAIDFVVRREFDHQIVAYAQGKPLDELPGVSFRKNGHTVNNPAAQ